MNDRQTRWHNRLNRFNTNNPLEPLVLDEAMIRQWLREHRVEYNSATDTIKACMLNLRLHRRHRKMVWSIYSRTDFSHLKQGG